MISLPLALAGAMAVGSVLLGLILLLSGRPAEPRAGQR